MNDIIFGVVYPRKSDVTWYHYLFTWSPIETKIFPVYVQNNSKRDFLYDEGLVEDLLFYNDGEYKYLYGDRLKILISLYGHGDFWKMGFYGWHDHNRKLIIENYKSRGIDVERFFYR